MQAIEPLPEPAPPEPIPPVPLPLEPVLLGPVPPARMPLLRGTRPLKRWRYVAILCDELMACAASVGVGPARQTFWAVLLHDGSGSTELYERTRLLPRRGAIDLSPGRFTIDDTSGGPPAGQRGPGCDVHLEFALEEDGGIAATCPHGAGYVWTRKQAGIAAHGTISIGGAPPRPIEARAVVDDTAGYHARVTEWRWAAGVGVDQKGTPLAFNLVEGVNDPPRGSERAVWVADTPHEAAPVSFAPDLSSIRCEDGSELRFVALAQRSRRENLLVVRSEYRAPFGTFSGTLPGGLPLAHAVGVVEHHRARW